MLETKNKELSKFQLKRKLCSIILVRLQVLDFSKMVTLVFGLYVVKFDQINFHVIKVMNKKHCNIILTD